MGLCLSNDVYIIVGNDVHVSMHIDVYISVGNNVYIGVHSRSQWPRDLRRRSAAAHLLRSWVESHWGHGCLSVVSVVCCQVQVSAMSLSLVQRSPTDCSAALCVI
jgi:hypothetical protein